GQRIGRLLLCQQPPDKSNGRATFRAKLARFLSDRTGGDVSAKPPGDGVRFTAEKETEVWRRRHVEPSRHLFVIIHRITMYSRHSNRSIPCRGRQSHTIFSRPSRFAPRRWTSGQREWKDALRRLCNSMALTPSKP